MCVIFEMGRYRGFFVMIIMKLMMMMVYDGFSPKHLDTDCEEKGGYYYGISVVFG